VRSLPLLKALLDNARRADNLRQKSGLSSVLRPRRPQVALALVGGRGGVLGDGGGQLLGLLLAEGHLEGLVLLDELLLLALLVAALVELLVVVEGGALVYEVGIDCFYRPVLPHQRLCGDDAVASCVYLGYFLRLLLQRIVRHEVGRFAGPVAALILDFDFGAFVQVRGHQVVGYVRLVLRRVVLVGSLGLDEGLPRAQVQREVSELLRRAHLLLRAAARELLLVVLKLQGAIVALLKRAQRTPRCFATQGRRLLALLQA